jgi:hypothetical protein
MPSLVLGGGGDSFDLDNVYKTGRGVQVLSGVTGLGLPPVSAQWAEGAGNGAKHRGERVLTRDIDLPLLIQGTDRDDLKGLVARFARMMRGEMTLSFREDGEPNWNLQVRRVGGGEFVYGADTNGERDLTLVLTLRAGDPYFVCSTPTNSVVVGPTLSTGMNMQYENEGEGASHCLWTITGPGHNFKAYNPMNGEVLDWRGNLSQGETLYIDTATGTVIDNQSRNRFAELHTAPRLWKVPPHNASGTVVLEGAGATSSVTCTYRKRKWMVV